MYLSNTEGLYYPKLYQTGEINNGDYSKPNSREFENILKTTEFNCELDKKNSNKTKNIAADNKKNADLSQTNKIFERNNNEIYFSKRK